MKEMKEIERDVFQSISDPEVSVGEQVRIVKEMKEIKQGKNSRSHFWNFRNRERPQIIRALIYMCVLSLSSLSINIYI